MTLGFLVAFGGPLLLVVLGYLAEALLARRVQQLPASSPVGTEGVDQALAAAEAAARQAVSDIAKARQSLLPIR